jgi:hypothetical protein
MQVDISLLHIIGDPGTILFLSFGMFTIPDHFGKALLIVKLNSFFLISCCMLLLTFRFSGKQNKAGVGTPPQNMITSYQGKIPLRYAKSNLSKDKSPPNG